jgi:hypothetical protein
MTTQPSRRQIIFGCAIYALFFGAMAFGLVMARREYPAPPSTLVLR